MGPSLQKVVGAGPASCASVPLGRARGFQVGWLPHSGRVLRGRVSMWGPLEGLSWYPVGGEISLLPLLSEHMGVLTLGTVSWSLCPPRLGSVLVCSGRGVCVVVVPVAHGSFLCSLAGVLLLVRTFQVRICLSLSESRASLMKTWLFLKRVCPLCRLLQGMVGESLPPSILFPKWGEGEFEKWGLGWPSPHGSGQHPSHSFACSFIHSSIPLLAQQAFVKHLPRASIAPRHWGPRGADRILGLWCSHSGFWGWVGGEMTQASPRGSRCIRKGECLGHPLLHHLWALRCLPFTSASKAMLREKLDPGKESR